MFTNYRHETGHRNVLPDPEPLVEKCLGIRHCRTLRHLKINIAKSEQSSHTPGGSHQRPFYLERKMGKGTDKQYVAEF